MGASDGFVIGTTKVVDHGPDNARWNLVIVGDGYQASEMSAYHTHVQNFITRLRATPPYNELYCGINIYRIDVASTQSGADDPGCGGNTPVTATTYFDATFCSLFNGSPLERLLTVDSALALSVATAQVPLRHQVLCIVNATKYGGAGGSVAVCSVDPQSAEIAIHEIGHSAFGLADEYGGDGSATPAGEFSEPNVTRDTNRATNKWGALIAPTTPMPTRCDGTCTSSTCVPPGTPAPAGAVGTYEGGKYADCNTYRPLPSCYMRDYAPFCPVCAGVIRATLAPFQPVEVINLVTPSISFTNVPAGMGGVGVTTHRAIRWDVVTCRTLNFQIIAGPTGGFGTPFGTSISVTSDPNLPMAEARIWLSYTSTNPGDSANGSVTVQCNETGQQWVINISANTISRPRSAVSLVLDRSGSMTEDSGDGISKVQKLREAADVFLNVMLPGDGVGIVRFNEDAQRLMEVQDVGASPGGAGRTTAIGIIQGSDLEPLGQTSIGDGVVNGRQMLDDAQAAPTTDYDVTAMVVLTDGMWNQPPSLADVSGSINTNTYAVGLGIPSNISVPALTTLCQGNNGYLLVTGALTTDQSTRLAKYFLQILAGVTNAQIAVDPSGVLQGKAGHRIPFWICEADFGMDVIVLSPAPYFIDFQLEAPDGTRITPGSGATGANSQYVPSQYAYYYRCALPVLPTNPSGSHEGLWHAVLTLGKRGQGYDYGSVNSPAALRVPYELVAHTYSSLTFSAQVTQSSFEIGASAVISAELLEYEAALAGRARVWAEIRRPNGQQDAIPLAATAGGRYTASYSLPNPGVYAIRVRARGETMYGRPFEREQTLTAVATPGGDRWDPHDPKRDPLCELLECLRKKGVITDIFLRRLKELGINGTELVRCLGCGCSKEPGTRPGRATVSLSADEMLDAIRQVLDRS